jgi:hypothetical protein
MLVFPGIVQASLSLVVMGTASRGPSYTPSLECGQVPQWRVTGTAWLTLSRAILLKSFSLRVCFASAWTPQIGAWDFLLKCRDLSRHRVGALILSEAHVTWKGRATDCWAFYCFSECPCQNFTLTTLPLVAVSPADAVILRPETPRAVTFEIPRLAQFRSLLLTTVFRQAAILTWVLSQCELSALFFKLTLFNEDATAGLGKVTHLWTF